MQIDLEKKEIADLLNMIKNSSFRGGDAEYVVSLKEKLETVLKEAVPEEDGKRDTS